MQRYITARCSDVAAATVTKELNVLKHLLRLAVEQWEYIPVNPAQGVKPPRSAPGRVRYLQPTELRALLEAAPLWLRPIIALAAATGMRRSEIPGLRWLDIDLNGKRILLPQTKNGDGRIVYLNQLALSAIESLPASRQDENFRPAISAACARMGERRVRPAMPKTKEFEIFPSTTCDTLPRVGCG